MGYAGEPGGTGLANRHDAVFRIGGQVASQVPELPREILVNEQAIHLHGVPINSSSTYLSTHACIWGIRGNTVLVCGVALPCYIK